MSSNLHLHPSASGPPRGDGVDGPAAIKVADQALLAESLAFLAPTAPAQRTAVRLLDRFGSLGAVLSAEPQDLRRLGLTAPVQTSALGLLKRLCVAIAREEAARQPVVSSWSALLAYVRAAQAHAPREAFRCLFLDRKNRLLWDELVGSGTVDHAPVYPREVVRRALELSASALILVHNHPSGDPTPSQADISTTRKIVEGARLFDIVVHDHLIVGRNGTASLRELGLMS